EFSAMRRTICPSMEIPMTARTIRTADEMDPQIVSSRPIRSAMGRPVPKRCRMLSISAIECDAVMAISVTRLTIHQRSGRKKVPISAALHQIAKPSPSWGGSFRSRSKKNVRPTSPSAQISTGMDIPKMSGSPIPSPKCVSKTAMMMGAAKTVTGLANSIKNARPNLPSKCTNPIVMARTANTALMGMPVQQAGHRIPKPIFVGDIDSRSSAMTKRVPGSVEKFSVNHRCNGEQDDDHHDRNPADEGDRPLENIPLGIFVDERERDEQCHEGDRQRHGTQKLTELTGEQFQPEQLEVKEKIPFRFGMVVPWIR